LGQTFFGLTSEHKVDVHKTLFAMAYHSNGAFNFEQVYNMPIYLRSFHLKQLEEAKRREAEQVKQVQPKSRPIKR
jgi:hypothetical protein